MRFPLRLTVVSFIALFLCYGGGAIAEDSAEAYWRAAVNAVKKSVLGGEKSFGIDTDIITTSEYDTGFGVETRFNQTFYHPYIDRPFLQSSPTLQFWGASNETNDLSVIGIIESLTHRIPMKKGITAFAGLTFGYYYIYKEFIARSDSDRPLEKNTNSFEIFITVGGEYELLKNSSLFLQLKYGETDISTEVHTILGITFRYLKEQEPK